MRLRRRSSTIEPLAYSITEAAEASGVGKSLIQDAVSTASSRSSKRTRAGSSSRMICWSGWCAIARSATAAMARSVPPRQSTIWPQRHLLCFRRKTAAGAGGRRGRVRPVSEHEVATMIRGEMTKPRGSAAWPDTDGISTSGGSLCRYTAQRCASRRRYRTHQMPRLPK